MQTQFLNRFAPNSLYLLFHPADTGNPNYDLNTHLEKFANRSINDPKNNRKFHTGNITRIDLEETQLIGGRVLGRVEIDLGSPDEAEQQHKILSIPYALKKLGTMDDAKEFVSVITRGGMLPASSQILALSKSGLPGLTTKLITATQKWYALQPTPRH